MKIGLVGPSYQERSLPFDAQRTINLYPVINETQQGKEVAALYGTSGLGDDAFNIVGAGENKAMFASTNGRAFAISDAGSGTADQLYELSSTSSSATPRGTLTTDSDTYTFAENPTQLAICNGTELWIFTYSTNTLAKVTDVDLPTCSTVTFQDGYFIVSKASSGQFYISALNDGTSWDALDFATAESSPDNLARVFSAFGQLWLLGNQTTEVWYNSGDADFPFSRIEGAKMQIGCAAPLTVLELDNSLFWVGQDRYGKGIVYRNQGYTAVRISTHAIEYILQQVPDLSLLKAWAYQEQGHLFYVITGEGLDTSLVFDASTQLWHERGEYVAEGWQPFPATTCIFAFGKYLVNAPEDAYEMRHDYYTYGGERYILRKRIFTHIHNEAKRMRFNELQVDFEYGVGLATGQGSDPKAMLRCSEDGGKTWSPAYEASIGKIGEYKARAVWRRLGISDSMTFEVSISDPVKVAICGAYLK